MNLHLGDCLEVMQRMIDAGERVHSVVCDPPYHLTSVVKRFGKEGAAPARPGTDGLFVRQSAGFMGKQWDGGDIAFRPETWRLCWELLPPGGYILAMGSSRTYGHLQVAMEEAGFITHPMIGWLQGQGFPKSHKIDGLDGWAYGGQALKPALEPIYMGQKPMQGTGAANWAKHGVGAVNIDGCRVPTDDNLNGGAYSEGGRSGLPGDVRVGSAAGMFQEGQGRLPGQYAQPLGRWPANLVHDGSPEVMSAFESFGQKPTGGGGITKKNNNSPVYSGPASSQDRQTVGYADKGTAARFFNSFLYCPKADRTDRNAGCEALTEKPLLWSAGDQNPGSFQAEGTHKAARNPHPTVKPTELMRWLCRLVTPPGGTVLDPFMGSGSTGKAAALEGFNFIGIEREVEYMDVARARITHVGGRLESGGLRDALAHFRLSLQEALDVRSP